MVKERKICKCGRVFFANPKDKDKEPNKYNLCQTCRNRSGQKAGIKPHTGDFRDDIQLLIWLERKRPDLVKRLRNEKK